MKKLLLVSYEWSLRILFLTVILLTGLVFFLSITDFPSVEPYIYPLQLLKTKPEKVGKNVWVGCYMQERKFLNFLKKNQIKVVISLLDVDMLHERRLLEREKSVLKEQSIKIYSVPMKPFLKDERKLKKLKRIISLNRRRRIYVHSYLGRIRTAYVREVLSGR